MDRLQKCIEALRAMAKEPEGNRQSVAITQIDDFVRPELAALEQSLKRLRQAASDEAGVRPNESAFWVNDVLDYVDTRLRLLSDLLPRLP